MVRRPIFLLEIGDLRIEAVLDSGFWNNFQLSPNIHKHNYCELMLCQAGEFAIALENGTLYPMTQNHVCLIPPGIYHRTANASPDARKLAIRFYCTRALTPGSMYNAFSMAMENRPALIPLGQQDMFLALSRQLCQELQSANLGWDSCAKAILTQLFVGFFRLLCKDVPSGAEPAPEELSERRLVIEEFFFFRYADPITEEDLAAHMHISKRQLSRILQKLYGTSFRKLLIDMRLSQAAQLLTTTELSAEEISARVGYSSTSGFYEAFRKRYGVPAGSYHSHLFR